MGFALRPGLHFCEAPSGFVFLDLTKDRYFRLPARLENDFRNLVENPLSAGAAAAPLLEAGVLRPAIFRQSLSRPRLIVGTSGPDALGGEVQGGFEMARAAASDLWLSQQLRLGRLAALIASYERSKVARTLSTALTDEGPVRVVRAYERAKLFRSPANHCLSRSLAMARRLAGLRCDALLVIGVRAHPHSHVMLRGKNDRGADLVIAREYISHGARERAMAIATLDLGPRTDLEIDARLRSDVGEERLTALDRRLMREMDDLGLVTARDPDPFQQSLRTGRLLKLTRMGLATHFGGDSWRLEPGFAETLRRMGERGDIIRTMQRELTARKVERAPTDRLIFDPGAGEGARLVGRVIMRGLADEHGDRHYLLVDGVDGRAHYADIGAGENTEPTPEGSIVSIAPRGGGVRDVDRTIVEVAAANDGRYSVDAHLRHDPAAQQAFAEAHVRRLEAMRKIMRSVEREPDGTWTITPNHLAKVEAFEKRQLRSRPVDVEILSADPIEKLPVIDAATWIDRELVADTPTPLRDAGFGREVKAAQALRRQWLIAEQLANEQDGQVTYRRGMLAALQRRELLRIAGQLSVELAKPFKEAKSGERIEGRLVRPVELASGRHALIERSRDFTLVPWRPVLDRQLGKPVAGIMRDGGINWTLGRQRSGPSIS